MYCKLSKKEINTFKTNVVPLKLIADTDITHADINWECDNDILRIRTFSGDGEFDFNDGVLLSMDKTGIATVCATLGGVRYECKVTVREPLKAEASDKMNYYIGDFHAHSSWDHTQAGFPRREKDFPADMVKTVAEENKLDFFVLSDHGSLMQNTDLFRTFYDADSNYTGDVIFFPGSESECVECHTDKFSLPQRASGEFVTVNSADFIFTDIMEDADRALARNPYAIVSIAHPSTWATKYGGGCMGTPTLYGADAMPEWKRAVKLIEMGNGTDRGTTMLFEHNYSLALDLGYKVSPVSTSDCHGLPNELNWGFNSWPGKTVIMAPEKSKEFFLDAILHNRVYATENGNTAIRYTVNESGCGETLALTNTYNFHVEITDLLPNKHIDIVKCEVISDYGRKIKIIENIDFTSFDFTVNSNSARYFYLRIVDTDGRKTWSAPVWTGREFDKEATDELTTIDPSRFTVTDSEGKDASIIVREDPTVIWYSDKCQDSLLIDMDEAQSFNAVTVYAPTYNLFDLRKNKTEQEPLTATYPLTFKLAISENGVDFKEILEENIRIFGIGYTVRFPEVRAKYVRLDLTATVGSYSELPKHKNAKMSFGTIEFSR